MSLFLSHKDLGLVPSTTKPSLLTSGYNFNTWESDRGGSKVQDNLQLLSEFQVSLCYMRPCLKNEKVSLPFGQVSWGEGTH